MVMARSQLPSNKNRLIGLLSADVDLGLQWVLGPLDLVRLVVVLGGAQRLNQSLQSRQIREEKAEMIPAPLSPQAVLRTLQVLVSVMEAYTAGYAYPLIFAVGGIAGNVGITTLAKAASPNLASTSPENREERQSLLFLTCIRRAKSGVTS